MPFGGLLTAGIIAAAGGIGGAVISANASGNAANTQVAGANAAAASAQQIAANSLAFQQQQAAQQQSNIEPWLAEGRGAVTTLGDLMGITPMPPTDMSSGGGGGASMPAATTLGGQYEGGVGSSPVPDSANGGVAQLRANLLRVPPGSPGASATAVPTRVVAPPTAGGPVAPPPVAAAPPPQATQQQQSPKVVRIVWPDGSGAQVSSDDLAEYQSLGAQVAPQ